MAHYICTACQYEGKPRRYKRGSRGMEIFIWAVLLVPGPFYSLYRRCFLQGHCPNCRAVGTMVSVKSDAGIMQLHKLDVELGLVTPRKNDPVVLSDKMHSTPAEQTDQPRPKRVIDPDEW